jgi:chromosome segregation protein
MHLKSITMKGFKSFPDRTRLDFGPGVSVVVGPNGSGKSNVTDAVLWAMGEQSPLAIRGQSMQDVIFGGGHGVQARSAAEVEIVLDNSDGTVQLPLSEISIVRRLDRSGEGEYRLNGARCRLVDVIEVLSDTGLGKETHSVISQGRVEAIVTSKARDRRMLIEEAAGLGKHRKRRRRAQLKLERTQENLDRALDVEREARTRLRPLKRQAEAAELHERLEHQMLQARFELARDSLRTRRVELEGAEASVQAARAAREQVEASLRAIVARRGLAEKALSDRAEQHDALARRAYDARSGRERLELRGEQARATATRLSERIARVELELQALNELTAMADGERAAGLEGSGDEAGGGEAGGGEASGAEMGGAEDRIAGLEAELAALEHERARETELELEGLASAREQAAARLVEIEQELTAAREARTQADDRAEQAREQQRAAEREVQEARREAARVGAELAAVNQFLANHSASAGGGASAAKGAPTALSQTLQVQPGFELALAAALGGRLDAALAQDLPGAETLLDGAGPDGATVLLAGAEMFETESDPAQAAAAEISGNDALAAPAPPVAGAQWLLGLVRGPAAVVELARRLLADAWVVERLEDLPEDFAGLAVTRSGRVWFAAWGELRQVNEGGAERVLARRNKRERLIGESESAAQAELLAKATAEQLLEQVRAADGEREQAERALRDAQRRHTEVGEEERRTAWLIEQRRTAPEQGPSAVRRAQLEGELAAERRQAERVARERAERARRLALLRAQQSADSTLLPLAERLVVALGTAAVAVAGRVDELEAELARDRAAGEGMSAELRACASEEAEIQSALRAEGEAVTGAEVAAQRLRDQAAEAELELRTVAEALQLPVPESDAVTDPDAESEPSPPLDQEQLQVLRTRLERLARRREQLGPVNPLAQEEYAEAIAHVEELESRRTDLETALRELRAVIRETDRQIHETFHATFTAAARNFEELVGDVFPGGSGRLRLVKEDVTPRPVLGGQPAPRSEGEAASEASAEAEAEAEAEREELQDEDLMGVEIEITPAGKSTKRLSLLSGGEKSMTALAFLFAVFLARPCPFYIMDEVEAALDDLNLDRFLALLRRYAGRAQFIVITHQKRTMEAADWLYGVSMGGNGVSKILSRRLPPEESTAPEAVSAPELAAAPEAEAAVEEPAVAEPDTVSESTPRPEIARVA